MQQTKKCRRCEKIKPIDQYNRSKTTKDGGSTYCKNCSIYLINLYKTNSRLYYSEMSSIKAKNDIERFWSHVNKNGENGCWVWTLPLRIGYGRFHFRTHLVSAHRFSYELLHGKVDNNLTLDHLCRNRACVNPAHLEPVTMRTNALRGVGPTAINARKTHCKRGHLLSGTNIQIKPDGSRSCLVCKELSRSTPKHKAMKRECDKRYREKNRKKCVDCGVLVHMSSLYCKKCSWKHRTNQ